jgi:hypothetical protein
MPEEKGAFAPDVSAGISPPRRITEPFVKARFALWLFQQGAVNITVSVDGAEPDADEVRRILISEGYGFERAGRTLTSYAGIYTSKGNRATVGARPGPDITAEFGDGRRLQAECKGEKTVSGVRSGTDWSGFCEVLGQLLMAVGDLESPPEFVALVLPKTQRVVAFAERAGGNNLLRRIPVLIGVVDADGRVESVGRKMQFK